MHFDILVEDVSGEKMLNILVPKILEAQHIEHTYNITSYKGIGRIPKGLTDSKNAKGRQLLALLPKLLSGYGKTYAAYPDNYPASLIIVCDLDDKCLKTFRKELITLLDACTPPPPVGFCIAIEEGEAWLLGDIAAIKKAYPDAKNSVLKSYNNDSICGTWEVLADTVYPGGSSKLSSLGFQAIGHQKSIWAEKISQYININKNKSPSFNYFKNKMIMMTE